MNLSQIIAGTVAGFVGAAIWAAISYYANIEIGYVAWGIGILVGIAVAATGENGAGAGIVAVLITVLSLLGGKYAAVELQARNIEEALGSQTVSAESITDEALQSDFADKIIEERESTGESVSRPEIDLDDTDAPLAASYPRHIWAEAGDRLEEATAEEKDAMRAEHARQIEEMIGLFSGAMRDRGFRESFSAFDLLFFGLAVVTAWGIAARDE